MEIHAQVEVSDMCEAHECARVDWVDGPRGQVNESVGGEWGDPRGKQSAIQCEQQRRGGCLVLETKISVHINLKVKKINKMKKLDSIINRFLLGLGVATGLGCFRVAMK